MDSIKPPDHEFETQNKNSRRGIVSGINFARRNWRAKSGPQGQKRRERFERRLRRTKRDDGQDGSGNPGLRVWATGCSITTDLKRGNEAVGTSKRRGCQTGAGMTKGERSPLCSFANISVALRHQRPCERYYFTKRNDSTNRNHST